MYKAISIARYIAKIGREKEKRTFVEQLIYSNTVHGGAIRHLPLCIATIVIQSLCTECVESGSLWLLQDLDRFSKFIFKKCIITNVATFWAVFSNCPTHTVLQLTPQQLVIQFERAGSVNSKPVCKAGVSKSLAKWPQMDIIPTLLFKK